MISFTRNPAAIAGAESTEQSDALTTKESSAGLTLTGWLRALSADANPPVDESVVRLTPGLLRLFSIPVGIASSLLRDGLREVQNQSCCLPGSVEVIESELLKHLHSRLKLISERTLALELQVAAIQGQLSGDTPAARFESFTERLQRPEVVRSILAEYPILAEQALNCINQWVRSSLEFLRHLTSDWRLLQRSFSFNDDVGRLVELKGDAGDRHADGKAVIILRFETGFRLVYKPRSMAVDRHFQDLLTWCNAHGASPPLRNLDVIDLGDHGWVEFVEPVGCRTVQELGRFYQRQGMYLALLYVLQATDFHFENLIAAGEHLFLVDLETLFHERLPGVVSGPAIRGMSNSVVSIGILPRISYYEGFDKGVDFSGLGASTGQEIEIPTYEFQADGTDEMRLSRVEMHTLAGKHRPTIAGAEASPAEFEREIIAGFSDMYRLLQRHRAAVAGDDGPLAAFAAVETRFIARATQIYGLLLEQSFHPDFLRDQAKRSVWFDQLWSQANEAAGLRPLVAAERAELERNDIPLFHMHPGSRDLWSSSGERYVDYFPRTPLETVRERLVALGHDDFARQSWLLRAAIAKLQPTEPALVREQLTHFGLLDRESTHPQAAEFGERLSTLAWQNEREAGWLGIQWRGQGWFVDAVGLEAGGLIEIASFLTSLDQAARSSRYVSLVTKTLHAINSIPSEGELGDEKCFYARIVALVASLCGYGNETTTTEVARLKRRLAEIDETRAGLPCMNSDVV